MKILVIADHNNKILNKSTLSTIKAASEIGPTEVLVLGSKCITVADYASKIQGIDKIYINDSEYYENFLSENCAKFIAEFSNGYSHILFSNNATGKNIAPRLAGLLDSMIISDVIEIIDTSTFKRPIYAGNAIATCKSTDLIKIMTIRSTAFEEAAVGNTTVKIEKINNALQNETTKFIKADIAKSERPELTSAEIVVSGGRGLGSAENFEILEKLADKLGAAMGASRAAVDAGFVPNDWQVGQTGKIVAPNLYIAVGISGAIQHLAGMKDSKVIVAVNKDGSLATCFITSNHEHHTLACFKSKKVGIDHHSYEVGEWNYIRDWCDHFASKNVQLLWGPGRHGPGNNLFVFIEDTDKNWIELSAELEIIHDREKKIWPQAEKTLNLWGKAILRS